MLVAFISSRGTTVTSPIPWELTQHYRWCPDTCSKWFVYCGRWGGVTTHIYDIHTQTRFLSKKTVHKCKHRLRSYIETDTALTFPDMAVCHIIAGCRYVPGTRVYNTRKRQHKARPGHTCVLWRTELQQFLPLLWQWEALGVSGLRAVSSSTSWQLVSRGAIVNRTYGIHKNLYI